MSSTPVPAVSGTGILPVEELPITKRHGAKLPHWTQTGAIYAVTFRLADSLPAPVVESWKREREEIEQRAKSQSRSLTWHERKELGIKGSVLGLQCDSHATCPLGLPISDSAEEPPQRVKTPAFLGSRTRVKRSE
jgi:hypothetical protein